MSSSIGETLKITIYGASHADSIGVRICGFPADFPIDLNALSEFMKRRAPGNASYATARKEPDTVVFASGLKDGVTDGTEIHAFIRNTDVHSEDYKELSHVPRPSHADYPAYQKSGGTCDLRGGGAFSGRMTAPLCIAGGICLQYLKAHGITVGAHIASIHGIPDAAIPEQLLTEGFSACEDSFLSLNKLLYQLNEKAFAVLDDEAGAKMQACITEAAQNKDSVGGEIECVLTGVPIGLGDALFDGLETRISAAVFGIPAVKGISFGNGFDSPLLYGSQNNDAYRTDGKSVLLSSNRNGGILGGMATGLPIFFRAAIKPTPSIARPQDSVDLSVMENTTLSIKGRHDPCIVPRAVPCVMAAAAIALTDAILSEPAVFAKNSVSGEAIQPDRLFDLRTQIDQTNEEIVSCFKKRMELCKEVAAYKKENQLPVMDAARERELLEKVSALVGTEFEAYTRVLFSTLMELSRSYQNRLLHETGRYAKLLEKSLADTPKLFPERATCACCGVEGAYAQTACEKLFAVPSMMYFNSFDNTVLAVESGLCRYGILPLENSSAGSVNHVYDLMKEHHFYIVRSVKIQIHHCLLAAPGTKLSDIKEIISHEQALMQCSTYLGTLSGVKLTQSSNTAAAAKEIASAGRSDVAVIAGKQCEKLYGLQAIAEDIENTGNNCTRFICIAKNCEIYPGADHTSLMMRIPHKPGSLYRVISRFYALGMNLTKLESRPIQNRDFEFMFYFDVSASVYSPALLQLISELEQEMEDFVYLGSYITE